MSIKETADNFIVGLTVNKLVYLLVTVIGITNTVSLTVQRVSYNQEKIEYSEEANKRRNAHIMKEVAYQHEIMDLKGNLKNMKQDLGEKDEDIEEWKLKYKELKEKCKD